MLRQTFNNLTREVLTELRGLGMNRQYLNAPSLGARWGRRVALRESGRLETWTFHTWVNPRNLSGPAWPKFELEQLPQLVRRPTCVCVRKPQWNGRRFQLRLLRERRASSPLRYNTRNKQQQTLTSASLSRCGCSSPPRAARCWFKQVVTENYTSPMSQSLFSRWIITWCRDKAEWISTTISCSSC